MGIFNRGGGVRFERVATSPLRGESDDKFSEEQHGRPIRTRTPEWVEGGSPLGQLRSEIRKKLVTTGIAGHHEGKLVGPGRERQGYKRALKEVLQLIAKLEAEEL